jgi:hypothetical protein
MKFPRIVRFFQGGTEMAQKWHRSGTVLAQCQAQVAQKKSLSMLAKYSSRISFNMVHAWAKFQKNSENFRLSDAQKNENPQAFESGKVIKLEFAEVIHAVSNKGVNQTW